MHKIISILVLLGVSLLSIYTAALEEQDNKYVYLTIDKDSLQSNRKGIQDFEVIDNYDSIATVKILKDDIEKLSNLMHEKFNRCGGFMTHPSYDDAVSEMLSLGHRALAKKFKFVDYTIKETAIVSSTIMQTDAKKMQKTIEKLSQYKNRHYKSDTGVASQKWLAKEWKTISKNRSDISVELFNHSDWPQPSVILKIKGSSDQAIVVGGHGDSIASSIFGGGKRSTAPGADDNASGIATITEIVRLLVDSSYKPEKTLYFISYAAEEVGLLGSREIAKDFKKRSVDVLGVLQLDMTNFKGSENLDIVMMTDYTNVEQNKFLGSLIETYLPNLKWGFDKCGYGCSDHASWHAEGFPASVPFEARKKDMNRHIHSKRDTISRSGGHALHAVKFAKLGLAYVIELDRE
jgi:leucyl aminopeptidase